MIGGPVVRTAAVVGTAKVVSNGVDRRQDRRETVATAGSHDADDVALRGHVIGQ